jgi:hypothetical protein
MLLEVSSLRKRTVLARDDEIGHVLLGRSRFWRYGTEVGLLSSL